MKIAFGDQCRAQRFGGNCLISNPQGQKVLFDACHVQPHSVLMRCMWTLTNFVMFCLSTEVKKKKKQNIRLFLSLGILQFMLTKVDKM